MEQFDLFVRFGSALIMGFFIGLQREYSKQGDERLFAGIRTFPLIALSGAGAAYAAELLGDAAAFVTVAGIVGLMIVVAYAVSSWRGEIGMTTEAAAALTLVIGALCVWNQLPLAAALTVTTAIILTLKPEMRGLIESLTREDIFAALKFAAITAIVLPVLPDQTFGPLDVFNPYQTWLMVVLISGISFSGYILIKIVGSRRGIHLTGLLGGLVSSTAVTLSMTQRSQRESGLGQALAVAIIVSWGMMFATLLIQVAVVNQSLLVVLWPAIAIAGAVTLAYAVILYYRSTTRTVEGDVTFSNPFELRPAITFGLLYAVVLFISRGAQELFGDTSVSVSSALAGMSGVDAVTLSMAQLSQESGSLTLEVAARGILLAVGANTVVKGGFVMATGSPALRRAVVPGFFLIVATIVGVAFWV
jgi:uncharacterized membrane protein (DUF4010 family)